MYTSLVFIAFAIVVVMVVFGFIEARKALRSAKTTTAEIGGAATAAAE